MGKKGGSSTSTTTNTVPENVLRQYDKVVERANVAATAPYEAYDGQLSAGWNMPQQDALAALYSTYAQNDNIQRANADAGRTADALVARSLAQGNAYQPYFSSASDMVNLGTANVSPTPYSPSELSQYLSSAQQGQNNLATAMVGDLRPRQYSRGAESEYLSDAQRAQNNMAAQNAGALMPEQFSAQAVGQYMSPYQQSVIDATLANINRNNAIQQQGVMTDAIRAGNAFGGDRMGVAQAELARGQAMAANQTIAELNNQNYAQALNQFNNQQQTRLGAAQQLAGLANQNQALGLNQFNNQQQTNLGAAQNVANIANQNQASALGQFNNQQQVGLASAESNAARALQGAGLLGNLGSAAQNNSLAGVNSALAALGQRNQANSLMNTTSGSSLAAASGLLGAGGAKQQLDQAGLDRLYEQWQNRVSFPYEQIGWLGNLSMGIGSNSGGTSTTTTQQSGGGLFSDRRIKTGVQKVGETYDGQSIYRYRLKGQPGYQIGLMAQEVLRDSPDAVSSHDGVLAVDYKKATNAAAKRGNFASGGVPSLSSVYPGSSQNRRGLVPPTAGMSTGNTIPAAPRPPPIDDGGDVVKNAVVGAGQKALTSAITDPKAAFQKVASWLPGSAAPAAASTIPTAAAAAAPATAGLAGSAAAAAAPEVAAGLAATAGLDAAGMAASAATAGESLMTGITALLSFLSDKRAKEAAERVGETYDGQPVYRYKYRGEPEYRMGLMAQDVEKKHPDAVSERDGLKLVNYHDATEDAARRGKFSRGGRSGYLFGGAIDDDIVSLADAPTIDAKPISIADAGVPELLKLDRPAEAKALPYFGQRFPGNPDGQYVDPTELRSDVGGGVVPALARREHENYSPPKAPPPLELRNIRPAPVPRGVNLAGEESAAMPQPTYSSGGAFDRAVNRTFGFEGGLNPNDSNGSPSNFGINQRANPDVDVLGLTKDRAREIYRDRYWHSINGDEIARSNPNLAHVAFDTSVIAGPGRALKFIEQSGGDASKFMDLRESYLNGLLAANPEKYGKYAKAWGNRNAGLRADIAGEVPSDALAYQDGSLGSARSSLPQMRGAQIGLGDASPRPPVNDNRGAAEGNSTLGNILGVNISPNVQQAILAGLFAMLASRQRSFLGALGEGGLVGLGAYRNAQDQDRQVGLANAQMANQASDAETRRGQLDIQRRTQQIQLMGQWRQINSGREVAGLPPMSWREYVANIGGGAEGGAPPQPVQAQLPAPTPAPITPPVAPPVDTAPNGPSLPALAAPQTQKPAAPTRGAPVAPSTAPAALPSADDAFWKDVSPSDNPHELERQRRTIAASGDIATAKEVMAARDKILQRGSVLKNGRMTPIPGYLEGVAATESAKQSDDDKRLKRAQAEKAERELQGEGAVPLTPQERKQIGVADDQPAYKTRDGSIRFGPAGSRVTVNNAVNPILKGLGEQFVESAGTARASADTVRSIHNARRQLDEGGGVISGLGADAKLVMQRFGAALGVADPRSIVNTETFKTQLKPIVLEAVKGLGAGSGISNADREFALQAVGGDINLDEGTIRRVLDITERASRYKIDRHNQLADDMLSKQKDLEGVSPMLRIDAPDAYRLPKKDGDPNAAAQSAPVRVTSPDDARKLPKGTRIILPDGSPGIVP